MILFTCMLATVTAVGAAALIALSWGKPNLQRVRTRTDA